MAKCVVGQSCHCNNASITTFGSKFTPAKVKELASSSVQLVTVKDSVQQRFASGTLISPSVVLCADHSLNGLQAKDIEILVFYECDAKTAPPPPAINPTKNPMAPPPKGQSTTTGVTSCTSLATVPQGKVVKVLEHGDPDGLDYALLAIEWKSATESDGGVKIVKLPRIPTLPKPGITMSTELLMIGHPLSTDSKNPQGEPTQVSPGTLTKQGGPNPLNLLGNAYTYATFFPRTGFSGGGVFNDKGELVGVFKGSRQIKDEKSGAYGPCFLDLGRAKDNAATRTIAGQTRTRPTCERLRRWFADALPLLDGDPKQNVVFRT